MKALVKAKAEPGLWMEDRPVPEIGPDDVLIRIHKTGICGTDVHIWNWDDWAQRTVPVPLVTGHEFAGEIVARGRDVTDLAVGQRCSGEGHSCRSTVGRLRHPKMRSSVALRICGDGLPDRCRSRRDQGSARSCRGCSIAGRGS